MIYRLESNTSDVFYSYREAQVPLPHGLDTLGHSREYQFQFEQIATDPYCPQYRVYKAPILPEWRLNTNLAIERRKKKNFDLPDFIPPGSKIYVSQLVKEVVEKCDPIGHQFWPVVITDKKGGIVSEKQYFRMNMRRYLNITPSDKPMQMLDFTPSGPLGEADFIPSVQHDPSLRNQIEKYPVWRHIFRKNTITDHVVYLNNEIFESLQSVGVTGLEEYTIVRGRVKGTIGHI
ncbi:MAG: hypothetical protein MI864_07315 [Pseudomonadales bacterium]|uniref:Immunity MXAN-0049 protein domain-containing protein n=1 Tax=Oleiphilus messinensis TaxID=141451 RepID=A0A1Y0I4W2_9GAMM|nr:DUF1629 domain-containing protein [Oleiphilus messinensis]ARU54575.1 hypothetical protein OLMES_0471 [Oleiphilus messinensis]MCG8610329.1 hypothetical protein [Pseudomonadales bacterium]